MSWLKYSSAVNRLHKHVSSRKYVRAAKNNIWCILVYFLFLIVNSKLFRLTKRYRQSQDYGSHIEYHDLSNIYSSTFRTILTENTKVY